MIRGSSKEEGQKKWSVTYEGKRQEKGKKRLEGEKKKKRLDQEKHLLTAKVGKRRGDAQIRFGPFFSDQKTSVTPL